MTLLLLLLACTKEQEQPDLDSGEMPVSCEEDCSQWGCETDPACIERCFDGLDNDGDGQIDCADPDCRWQPICFEDCSDAVDNDVDGQVDCLDPDVQQRVQSGSSPSYFYNRNGLLLRAFQSTGACNSWLTGDAVNFGSEVPSSQELVHSVMIDKWGYLDGARWAAGSISSTSSGSSTPSTTSRSIPCSPNPGSSAHDAAPPSARLHLRQPHDTHRSPGPR